MKKTSISWTDITWNPVTGCDRISSGCDHCYALTMARRLKAMGMPQYQTDGDPRTSGPGFGVMIHPEALNAPKTWTGRRMVFVNSMSDLFHARVDVGFIRQLIEVIRETPQHTYQILTKRVARARKIGASIDWPSNLWLGASVEDMAVAHRVEDLRQIPAAVKFLSCEPLLGNLSWLSLEGIDWVIAGGESGTSARPMHIDWARAIRDNCQVHQVPFYFKQWGGRSPKIEGRLLDGRIWDDYPEQVARHG
ncbi:MAG: phage Gp37/Gp68 family protein [Propionibacteriaceae bacterium]|nr:phage Gp37/Gp68 family protein [Propionibacteriaceae bacterium]